MTKVKKPQGLIRYQTGDQRPINLRRFRLVLYAALTLVFAGAFVWTLAHRQSLDFILTRVHSEPFSERVDNAQKILQNHFQVHLKNQKEKPEDIELLLAAQNTQQGFRILSPAVRMTLLPEQDLKLPVFIEIDEGQLQSGTDRQVNVILRSGSGEEITRSLHFVGREGP
jgi:hypothetical protein